MNRIRLGVVGCGGIATAYFPVLSQVPELELLAVADTDPGRLEATRERLRVQAFAGVEAMLQGVELDAAMVLTPPATHETIAQRLLSAGCHVLCEKPLSISAPSAERMVAAAERAQRTLMMASKFRYVQDVATARGMIESGLIGEVLLFENAFCSRVDMTRRWNSQRQHSGGGVLIDNGSHSVDVARFLLGPIERIQAQFGRTVQPIEVEDTARILFEARSGVMGSIDLSWSLHKEVTSYVRLYGARGTLEIGWKTSRYRCEGDQDWKTFGTGYDKQLAFRQQLSNFARSVLGLEPPLITAEDGLWSVRAIDAAYRSALAEKWVHVRPAPGAPPAAG